MNDNDKLTLEHLIRALPGMMALIARDEGIEAAVICIAIERDDRFTFDLIATSPEDALRLLREVKDRDVIDGEIVQ